MLSPYGPEVGGAHPARGVGSSMTDKPVRLPPADFIAALRTELRAAAVAKDPQLQFNVGPTTIEFTLMTHHEGGGKAGVRFWIVDAGASAERPP